MLSTESPDRKIELENEYNEIQRQKQFKESRLPDSDSNDEEPNPILDRNIRYLFDEFTSCWRAIFEELMDSERYANIGNGEFIHDFVVELFAVFKDIFWRVDRLFNVGIGLILISFFIFFICVTET